MVRLITCIDHTNRDFADMDLFSLSFFLLTLGPGFSLMAGLDLELDSDLDDDYAAPPRPLTSTDPATGPAAPVLPVFIPAAHQTTAPTPSGTAKQDLFAPEAGAPFFFYETFASLAAGPGGDQGQSDVASDEFGKKWLGSVQTLQGETIEVTPLVKSETEYVAIVDSF